jgi:prepilin-type N-terminal cleavage/methylation domain-containing protein
MRKKFGFTIVEVLISTVIFSLVVLGLSSVFISGKKLIIHSRERMTSGELGKFFLDPMQIYVSFDTWNVGNPNLKWDGSSNELRVGTRSGTAQSINNRTFSESHTVSAVTGTDLRRVVSTISWPEPN